MFSCLFAIFFPLRLCVKLSYLNRKLSPMIPAIRKQYNEQFTQEKYEAYIQELNNVYPGHLEFRVAETPLFIPKDFTTKVLSACDSIMDVITRPEYHRQSEKAVPEHLRVPTEDAHPQCISFD